MEIISIEHLAIPSAGFFLLVKSFVVYRKVYFYTVKLYCVYRFPPTKLYPFLLASALGLFLKYSLV